MKTAAEWSKDADTPVAQFIASAFNDNGVVVGNLACGRFLVGQELQEIFGRAGVKVVFRDQAGEGGRIGESAEFPDECADAAAELKNLFGLERHQRVVERRPHFLFVEAAFTGLRGPQNAAGAGV